MIVQVMMNVYICDVSPMVCRRSAVTVRWPSRGGNPRVLVGL